MIKCLKKQDPLRGRIGQDLKFYPTYPADVLSTLLPLFFSMNTTCQEFLHAIALSWLSRLAPLYPRQSPPFCPLNPCP